MSGGHTPGPWSRNIPPATRYPTIYAGRNTHVVQVVTQGLPAEEVEANADLVTAAPDLLALAERVARLNPDAGEIGPGMLAQLVAEARRVVARATGQAPQERDR